MIRFQRITQTVSFLLFVVLFYLAAYPYVAGPPVDFFLRLDPLIGIGTTVAARDFSIALVPGLILLAATLVMGRFFCGHICPMGTTLDVLQVPQARRRKTSPRKASYEANSRFRGWKYLALAVILAAAVGGVSLVYLGSPLSLVTRFYALVIWPIVLLVGDLGIRLTAPLWKTFPDLAYVQVPHKVFSTNVFTAILFAGITALAHWQPRFWCRNLCPAGALLGLFSKSPFIKRHVGESWQWLRPLHQRMPYRGDQRDPGQDGILGVHCLSEMCSDLSAVRRNVFFNKIRMRKGFARSGSHAPRTFVRGGFRSPYCRTAPHKCRPTGLWRSGERPCARRPHSPPRSSSGARLPRKVRQMR